MKKIKAFTLIETLIVIVVFCIGILVVLQGLSQTLRNKDYANTQIKAAFFAREGIELVFNLRDANYHKELPWNCIFNNEAAANDFKVDDTFQEKSNPFCKGYFGSGNDNIFKIGMGTGDEYIHLETGSLDGDFDKNFSGYQIYFHTGDISKGITGYQFNHEGTEEDEETWFARYLLITGVVAENNTSVDANKLLKIESHVLYKKGYLTGEKIMETFIGNYEFNQ